MFFLDPESKYERIFEFETMFLSCLFKELLPFGNCKMYRNVLKKNFKKITISIFNLVKAGLLYLINYIIVYLCIVSSYKKEPCDKAAHW